MQMFNPKRIPKWAWYTSAGVGIVGLVLYLRRQKSSPDPSQSAADQAGVTGYTDPMQNMPGIVVAPSSPPDLSGITFPDQPDIGSILGEITGLIGALYPGGIVPIGGGGGAPSTGGAASTGGVVTVPNPNPGPAKPNPCVGMDTGGSAGACKPAGAICRHMIGCGSNSEGHYCTWKFKFADGHTNCFNNYSSGKKAGQCVGPFGCP